MQIEDLVPPPLTADHIEMKVQGLSQIGVGMSRIVAGGKRSVEMITAEMKGVKGQTVDEERIDAGRRDERTIDLEMRGGTGITGIYKLVCCTLIMY